MNSTALYYALGTVFCWGLYSVLLHKGSMGMALPGAPDPTSARMKSFLLVGVAYFLVAILAPAWVLKSRGAVWSFPTEGWVWSLVAGLAGAVGAYFLLMALSSGRSPAESRMLPLVVPAIVFSGAPIVNAIVSITKDGVWGRVPFSFYAGIVLAAVGTVLVVKNRPMAAPGAHGKTAAAAPAAAAPMAPGYVDVTTRSYWVS